MMRFSGCGWGQKTRNENEAAKKAAAPEKDKPSGLKYMRLDEMLQAGKLGAHGSLVKLGGKRSDGASAAWFHRVPGLRFSIGGRSRIRRTSTGLGA